MNEMEDGLKDLREIRSMMERASRFLSLSGLSGVSAGTVGLLGASAAAWYLLSRGLGLDDDRARQFLVLDGILVLVLAAGLSFLFSWRMAARRRERFWTPAAREVLENLLVPLLTGGVFACILIVRGHMALVPGATLLFYGLALVAAARHTVRDLRQLGLLQIALGVASSAAPEYALLLWGIGFGVLHVAYGLLMYRKYER
jgi:hypothetical protein